MAPRIKAPSLSRPAAEPRRFRFPSASPSAAPEPPRLAAEASSMPPAIKPFSRPRRFSSSSEARWDRPLSPRPLGRTIPLRWAAPRSRSPPPPGALRSQPGWFTPARGKSPDSCLLPLRAGQLHRLANLQQPSKRATNRNCGRARLRHCNLQQRRHGSRAGYHRKRERRSQSGPINQLLTSFQTDSPGRSRPPILATLWFCGAPAAPIL